MANKGSTKKDNTNTDSSGWINEHDEMLLHAAEENDSKKIKEMVEEGANINIQDTFSYMTKWTVLMYVIYNNNIEIFNFLLDKGADVNLKNVDQMTALTIAAQDGKKDMMKALLDHGADVNSKSNGNWTPLMAVVAWGKDVSAVEFLISRGADVNAKDDHGQTALTLANGKQEIISLLKKSGAKE